MPDPVPNPTASVVVTPPPSPAPPQVQQPQTPPDQLPQGQGPQQFQPPTQQAPPPQSSPWHRAVSALLGSTTEYNQTPQGPVPVQVPNKPGNLFRSILAGAILGAGAGSANSQNDAGSGWSAAGRGAAAVQQNQQQQQQQRAAEAQKQWENQRQANQDSQEEQVRKAQIAQANAETLKTNVLTQGTSYEQHQKVVSDDNDRLSTYEKAGLKPVYKGIPESEMNDIIKNNPGSSTLDWRHTGTKLGVDSDGNPTYEYTMSAFDPKEKVPVSDATVKQWDEDGLFKYHPEYKDLIKPGKVLTVDQFTSLDKSAQNLYNQNLQKQKDQLGIKKDQAEINADNAKTAESLTNTKKIKQEISDAALGKTQAEQFDNALQELNSKGGNFDALKPSSRVVIAESMDKMVPALTAEYKDILASDDPEAQAKAGDVLSQIQNLTSLGTRALSGIGGTTSPPVGGSNIPPGALIAKNPTTGETRYSTDNGKTWNVAGAQVASPNIDRFRNLSAHDREIALADPKISPKDEDKIRRSLGVGVPDDSKYDNDIEVQKQIKKMKGVPPDQVEDRLSNFDFTPGQLMAIIRGAKNAESQ